MIPDKEYASMLNATNRQHGYLEMEIVPADQAGCGARGTKVKPVAGFDRRDLGICSGANVKLPRNGQHIRAIGAYVEDPGNHWFEIHPVWAITRTPRV